MKNKPLDEYVAEMGREKTKKLQNKIKRRRDFAGVLLFSVKLYFYNKAEMSPTSKVGCQSEEGGV